jgi:hypothetical protein
MKRVALTQARDRKQATSDRSVGLEAGDGVPGARWLEAASASQEARERPLVQLDDRDEEAREHCLHDPFAKE